MHVLWKVREARGRHKVQARGSVQGQSPTQRVSLPARRTELVAEPDLAQHEHLLSRGGYRGGAERRYRAGVYPDSWRRPWFALPSFSGGTEREGEADGGIDGAAEQRVERLSWRRRMRRLAPRGHYFPFWGPA